VAEVLDVGVVALDVVGVILVDAAKCQKPLLLQNCLQGLNFTYKLQLSTVIDLVVKVLPVVAEMHTGVPEVLSGRVVPDRSEPNEPLLVEVDAERVVGRDCHVEPKIPLVTVD
jgi:hypothetical protein